MIFVDELIGVLDFKVFVEVLECFVSINKSYNIIIIMVIYDVRVVSYVDRVMFL